jgi:hypothetical protein
MSTLRILWQKWYSKILTNGVIIIYTKKKTLSKFHLYFFISDAAHMVYITVSVVSRDNPP